MKTLIVLFTVSLLAACNQLMHGQKSTDVEATKTRSDIILLCSGFLTWRNCYDSANKACPEGYKIIGQEENLTTQARTLRIECKK